MSTRADVVPDGRCPYPPHALTHDGLHVPSGHTWLTGSCPGPIHLNAYAHCPLPSFLPAPSPSDSPCRFAITPLQWFARRRLHDAGSTTPTDPVGSAVTGINSGGFVMQFAVVCENDKMTNMSGRLAIGDSSTWDKAALQAAGIKANDSCWVAADIVAGRKNFNAKQNFFFDPTVNKTIVYRIVGTTLNPSWKRVD